MRKVNVTNSSLTSLPRVTLGHMASLTERASYTVNNKEEAAAASWVIPAALVGKVLEIMEITRKCHDNTAGNVSLGKQKYYTLLAGRKKININISNIKELQIVSMC